MDPEFWHERWKKNEIGFHQEDINGPLQKYWQSLKLDDNERVFVPLCGKSRDLLWIQSRGHPVLGVELSPLGVETFFKENRLQASSISDDKFIRWKCGTLDVLCGDFFDLRPSHLEGVAGVYDRASLVALPPEMREQYAKHFVSVLPQSGQGTATKWATARSTYKNCAKRCISRSKGENQTATKKTQSYKFAVQGIRVLLLTLEYQQREMQGPPFSVSEKEVNNLYGNNFKIVKLQEQEVSKDFPRFKERGLTSLTEKVFLLSMPENN
ncbi:MAG: thiopurine S-methyltransferase [Gammaproteobacteria bacterium]|jgi:thiopurine S-methyltransferase|nr:thiopurine S-methyltransferase [Gammaproteobacteria bacterium]HJP19014.1 thiopurine S-methyltransferase [Nitrospinota bacterium]